MYEDGKCCSTILNTWGDRPDEKWTSSMGIETIVLAFMSLLDNDPYSHEPGGFGDPSYTLYAMYQSWWTCMLHYFKYETDELFRLYINEYLEKHYQEIIEYVSRMNTLYPSDIYETRCYSIDNYIIDFEMVSNNLTYWYCNYNSKGYGDLIVLPECDKKLKECECSICYDTEFNEKFCYTLKCGHKFHIQCIEKHIDKNPVLCPICRAAISPRDLVIIKDKWITCVDGKRYRKNGRTYNKILLETFL